MSNQKKLIVMVISLSLILILSSSYALLRSTRTSQNNYVINVGDLKVNFQDATSSSLNASNMYPMTDEEGALVEKELVFTVKNEGTVKAYYNVSIEETSTNPEFKSVIKYIVKKDTGDYNQPVVLSENKYIDYNATLEATKEATYHVKVYLKEEADETYMGKTFNAKIHIESNQESYVKTGPLLDFIKNDLNDSNSVNDGDTTYLSGTNDQINFNYVWYSGKLWRITAINPDNTIKMITQDAITAITWNINTTYKGSWIYQWLNEDFLDTLESQENIIVQDAKWYATADSCSTSAKPTGATIDGKVGLLNAYEYYQSYKNLGSVDDDTAYGSGYLNIGYIWWQNYSI